MNWIASCSDCSWTYQHDDREAVTEALERHGPKERHHVDVRRQHTASA